MPFVVVKRDLTSRFTTTDNPPSGPSGAGCEAQRGGSTGNVTVKVVPSPSRLSTRIEPP